MRKNLGKALLIIITILSTQLFASTYEWNAAANKSSAMTNEAIYLKYSCEFSDRGELYSIDFNPVVENETYSIKLLSESEKIVDNRRVNTYEFVAFVKVHGEMAFEFDTLMKKTTQESIENTVLGRDNVENEEFSKITIKQKKVLVDVVESRTELVGKFNLEIKKDDFSVKAYEPYHMRVTISGLGNFSTLKDIVYKIDGVKVFSSKPINETKLTKDGYEGSWSQDFAFVAQKNFFIPETKIEYFDLEKSKYKEMLIPSINIEVSQAFEKEELLDKEEEAYRFDYDYIYFCLTFIAGFLAAKIKFKVSEVKKRKNYAFRKKVKEATSLEELAIILIMEDSDKYRGMILSIETKENASLRDVKKELLN